jgi:hypothetical protein
MKKLIPFMLLSALALFVAGCSRSTSTSMSSAVETHLAWIPQEVNSVAYFDVQSVRQSELGKSLEKDFDDKISRWRDDEDYREFLEKTGFDVQKDLHNVLLGFEGDREKDSRHFAVIATGNFDEQKIINAIKTERDSMEYRHRRRELATETYNGKTIYVIKEDGEKACYFADANTLVTGSKEWIQAIIDGNNTDKSVQKNSAVAALLDKLRYKDQCWFVANTTAMMEKVAEELGESGEFKGTRAVKAVQNIVFSANVGSKAELYGEALCDSEDNSQLLTEAMKGALATAKLAVSDDRDAVDMLNRVDVDRAGKAVKMSARLDKAFFDKMRERAGKHGRAVALF